MRRDGKSSKSSYDRSQGNQAGDGPREDVINQQEGENQEKEG